MITPELSFDYDYGSGNIKVKEEPVILKNETQKKFLEAYNKKVEKVEKSSK